MGCASSTSVAAVHGIDAALLAESTAVPVKPPSRQIFDDDGKNQAQEHSSESPVYRAVALAWLAQFVKAHDGTTQSWDVVKEFMNEEDGGGTDAVLTVTPHNLEMHRDKRRAAEKARSRNQTLELLAVMF